MWCLCAQKDFRLVQKKIQAALDAENERRQAKVRAKEERIRARKMAVVMKARRKEERKVAREQAVRRQGNVERLMALKLKAVAAFSSFKAAATVQIHLACDGWRGTPMTLLGSATEPDPAGGDPKDVSVYGVLRVLPPGPRVGDSAVSCFFLTFNCCSSRRSHDNSLPKQLGL